MGIKRSFSATWTERKDTRWTFGVSSLTHSLARSRSFLLLLVDKNTFRFGSFLQKKKKKKEKMAPLPNELNALDDPKWRRVDDKIKGLLKRGLPKKGKLFNKKNLFGNLVGFLDKRDKSKKDSSDINNKESTSSASSGNSATKWLLSGPRGACLAAIIPGDSAAESVLTLGLLNFINLYNFVLIVRVLLTWFPNPPGFIIGPVSTLADPYLNLFRGIIPPIGGTLDLSPVLAFLSINVFTNAAEALPCELQQLQQEVEEEEREKRLRSTRRRGLGGGGKKIARRKGKVAVAALSKEQLDSKHPTWSSSRMNPLLLLEGLRQAKERFQ